MVLKDVNHDIAVRRYCDSPTKTEKSIWETDEIVKEEEVKNV